MRGGGEFLLIEQWPGAGSWGECRQAGGTFQQSSSLHVFRGEPYLTKAHSGSRRGGTPPNSGVTEDHNRAIHVFDRELHGCRAPLRRPPAAQVARLHAHRRPRPRARHRRQRGAVQRGEFGVPPAAGVSRAGSAGPIELDEPGAELNRVGFSYPRFLEVQQRQQVFSHLALSVGQRVHADGARRS